MRKFRLATAAVMTATSVLFVAPAAVAGDCTGRVVGVRPISQYNHATGSGYLAVRNGPGGSYRQIGELYAGDEVSVHDRRGNWYAVTCMSGRCSIRRCPVFGKRFRCRDRVCDLPFCPSRRIFGFAGS